MSAVDVEKMRLTASRSIFTVLGGVHADPAERTPNPSLGAVPDYGAG